MLRVFQSTKLRYLLVGIGAFILGSATIGAAAASESLGSLFYTTILNGQPTQPCVTQTTGQGSTTVCTAIVDSNGNLHVANQGTSTVSGTVGVNNFPADQQVHGTVGVNNLPADQQVHGTVGVNNFPVDQLVHGTVTVSNLPGVSGGTTAIPLGVETAVPSGGQTTFDTSGVSACRAMSVFLMTPLFATGPHIDNVYVVPTAGLPLVPLDHHDKTLESGTLSFLSWPGTNEPAFAMRIVIYATNADGAAQDMSGEVLCSH